MSTDARLAERPLQRILIGFVTVAAAVTVSFRYLDVPIARCIAGIIFHDAVLSRVTGAIPDLLLPLVIVTALGSWTLALYLAHQEPGSIAARFFWLLGTSVVVAYALKAGLGHLFGRPSPRRWLADPQLYGFHWWSGADGLKAFPSGHMSVFTAALLAVSHFYPRSHAWCIGLLCVLAAALIGTDYHFLSDIIAGAYCGMAAHGMTLVLLRQAQTFGH
jgi:membrane-associated phospholipid phosphatase